MLRKTAKLKITCRMCGKSFDNKPLLMLYQKYKQFKDCPVNIIQKYNLLNFQIFENDGLPQQICNKCIQEFKTINEFIESCINVQENLRKEFSHLKFHKFEKLNKLTDKKPDNVYKNNTNGKRNKVKSKDLYQKSVSDEEQVKVEPSFENVIINESIKDEKNLSSVKIEIEDDNEFLMNSTENIHSHDNDDISEEYFNDNFQEDFTIKCEFCKKVFNDMFKLEEHQNEKHKMKLYNKFLFCDVCGQSIIHYRFEEHVAAIHERKTIYQCQHCERGFKRFRAFKDHSLKYHQSDQNQKNYDNKEKYPCQECNRVYLSSGVLLSHIKKVHSGPKKESDKKLNQKSLPPPVTFQCDVCKLKFRNIVSMEKHRANHAHEKYEHKFECPDCDRRFGRRDHLKYHIRLEHLNEKPYKCQQCDKSYVIGFQLNTHMKLVHSRDKTMNRARCDRCDKTFYNERYLLRHKKEVHSFEAQFICVICDERFFKQTQLTRHSEIHNVEEHSKMITDSENEHKEQNSENNVKVTTYVGTVKKNHNIDNEIEEAVSILVQNDDDINFNVFS